MGKKNFTVLMMLIMLICVACGREESESLEHMGVTEENTIHMIVDNMGYSMSSMCSTDDGCYMVDSQILRNGSNIMYVDYKTRKKIYLSSSVNGDYWSETDTSYFPNGSIIGFFVDSDDLYAVVIEDRGDEQYWVLYRMDLDGQNREELYSAGGDAGIESGIGTDGKYLYFVMHEYKKQEIEYKLCALDKETGGDLRELYHFDTEDRQFGAVRGFFDRNVVWTESSICDDLINYEEKMFVLDIDSGVVKEVKTWTDNELGNVNTYISDSKWYYFDLNREKMVCFDLRNNTEEIIMEKFPFEVNQEPYSLPPHGEIDGDYLKIIYEGVEYYNLKTGEIMNFTLHGEGGSLNSKSLLVFGESKDEFMVVIKEIPYELYMEPAPGFSGLQSLVYYDYAMIKKEDYYNNRPNYMMIEDMQVREGTPVS